MHNQKHRLRHTQVPCGSRLRWPLRESTSKPTALTPGRSMQREIAGQHNSTAFQIREAFQQRVCRGFMVTHLPSQGNQAKEGSRKAAEGGWAFRPRDHSRVWSPSSQRWTMPPTSGWDGQPQLWEGSLPIPPFSKDGVPLPTMQVSHVPHVSQMQGKNSKQPPQACP